MIEQLLQYNDIGLFVLRAAVGSVFLYHGFPKLAKTKMMAGAMGAPAAAVFALGLVEIISGLGLILGLYVQIAALVLGIVMMGSTIMKIAAWGVPFAAMDKTGWEFDFILLAANIALLLGGGGSVGL